MHDRWAVMNGAGEWARDEAGKVLTFFIESSAIEHRNALHNVDPAAGWTTEPFTVEDALEEMTRSPFATEGGL
jgi:hypothetical protein